MTGLGGRLVNRVLIGYICKGLLVSDREVDEMELAMMEFAAARGFLLVNTYVEQPLGRPDAFGALVNSLHDSGADAVLLPGLLHFAVLGPGQDIKKLFERATGVRVLVL
jgi:hypothetical protein